MIPGWGRSSWRVPGRTPKLSRSSASVIGPTRVWCSCGQEAGTPRLAWHSSNTPGYRSSTRRTNWPEACRAASRIIHGASVAWPMALPRPRRARRRRMRPSPRLLAWGVRHSRSPRASSCWQPGAWGVRASTGQILQRPPSRPQSSSGFRWLSRSIRRIFRTRQRPGSFG